MELILLYAIGIPLCVIAAFVGAGAWVIRAKGRKFNEHRHSLLSQLKLECEDAYTAEGVHERDTLVGAQMTSIKEEPDTDAPQETTQPWFHEAQRLEELPQCVQDYLRHCVRDPPPHIKLITLRQKAELRFKPGGKWMPLEATQHACPLKPAFLFSGSMPLAPLTWAAGFERLLGAKGESSWRAWGAVPLASGSGPVADQGAHTRWLAEAVCFPQALMPSRFLRWEAVKGSDNEAEATVSFAGGTASATFTFNARHNVAGFRSSHYARTRPDGSVEQCSVVGRCKSPMLFGLTPQAAYSFVERSTPGGIVIPTESEAAFVEKDGTETPFFKVLVTRVLCE